MAERYLAIIRPDILGLEPPLVQIAEKTGLRLAASSRQYALFMEGEAPNILSAGGAVAIVGRLFHRHGYPEPITGFSDSDIEALRTGGSTTILDRYWGGYIAIIETDDEVQIVRDPSAAALCFYTQGQDFVALTSDARLLRSAGLIEPEPDYSEIGRMLFTSGLPSNSTALRGVKELGPGEALWVGRNGLRTRLLWSPWDFTDPKVDGDPSPSEGLQRAVRNSVRAWAACHKGILLGVSGGLDSSIVATSFRREADNLTFVTVSTHGADGDERHYARLLSKDLDRELLEEFFSLDDVDLDRPVAPHLPYPVSRSQSHAYDTHIARHAVNRSAAAFFTGNGGDNVFAYSHSARALADRYISQGMSRGLFSTIRHICKLTGCSPWQAMRAGVSYLPATRRGYRWRPNPLFLSETAIAENEKRPISHPWLEAPTEALPGKAAHIAGLLQIQRHLHASESNIGIPVVNPLISQPVLETCLTIPSWHWLEEGFDRAVARQAFANELPAEILRRSTKGRPDSFCSEIIASRREEIAERLTSGLLARNGVIDVDAIASILLGERPDLGREKVRLLELLEAEAWLMSWQAEAT